MQNFECSVTRSMTGSLPLPRAIFIRNPFTRRMIRNTVESRRKLAVRALREASQGRTPPFSESIIKQWLSPNLDRILNPATNRMVKATPKNINTLNEFITNSLDSPKRVTTINTVQKAVYKRIVQKYINQHESSNLSANVRYENNLSLPCINAGLFDDVGWARSAHDYRLIFDTFIYPKLLSAINSRLQHGPVKVASQCSYQLIDRSNDDKNDPFEHANEYPYRNDDRSWWYNWGDPHLRSSNLGPSSGNAMQINDFQDIQSYLFNLREALINLVTKNSAYDYLEFIGIHNLTAVIINNNPMGSQCEVDLPEHIQAKKCCINIQNKDNRCFAYALTASKLQLQKDRPERPNLYLPEKNGIIEATNYPVSLHDIPKWERLNKININVFCLDDKETEEVVPLKISKQSFESSCDLLLNENHYY